MPVSLNFFCLGFLENTGLVEALDLDVSLDLGLDIGLDFGLKSIKLAFFLFSISIFFFWKKKNISVSEIL